MSPGQVRIRVLQLCILITVSQLTLHASIAAFVLRVLFRRALAPILILGLVRGCFLPFSYGTVNTQIHAGANARNCGRVTIETGRDRFWMHECRIRCQDLRV
jgi:hypothetical protein